MALDGETSLETSQALFGVDDARVVGLAATRMGRVSQAGFCYQIAYAVARIASMHTRGSVLGCKDIPIAIRYDWAEDLDEAIEDNGIVLTQCKRVIDIGQPRELARVLLGFAPKYLWTEESARIRLRFRLVCPDPRFSMIQGPTNLAATPLSGHKQRVIDAFLEQLNSTPTGDRRNWHVDARNFGFMELAIALWSKTEVLYVKREPNAGNPIILPAEAEALDVLQRNNRIHCDWRIEVLNQIRGLIHDNVVEFDLSTCRSEEGSASLELRFRDLVKTPRIIYGGSVRKHLEQFRYGATRSRPPLRVTSDFLRHQASLPREPFVARPPTWSDVAAGEDPETGFIERDQTAALLHEVRIHLLPVMKGAATARRPVVLFGPPGSGKSTLVRRVAATLVRDDSVIVVDPGLYLDPLLPDEKDNLISFLEATVDAGAKVLLLLDDPFFHRSGWPEIIRDVGERLPVGVLAASPEHLYERFRGRLEYIGIKTNPPGYEERNRLKSIWKCEDRYVRDVEDFFVLCMQAFWGRDFSEIARELWITVNGGEFVRGTQLSQLAWPVASLLLVSFFARFSVGCPESLLRQALASREPPDEIGAALLQLKGEKSLKVFRYVEDRRANWDFAGPKITLVHQRLAQELWNRRPPSCGRIDVWRHVVDASLAVPDCVKDVAVVAGQSFVSGNLDPADRLAQTWLEAPPADVRLLSTLANNLWVWGCREAGRKLVPALLGVAANPSESSWLAAACLTYFGEPLPKNIVEIVRVGDFGLAPNRALKFGKALVDARAQDALEVYRAKLLDGLADGTLGAYLLTWLLGTDGDEIIKNRWTQLEDWLEMNHHSTDVRAKAMELVQNSRQVADETRLNVARNIRRWLSDSRAGTGDVWTKYLTFLQWPLGVPTGKAKDRIQDYDPLVYCYPTIQDEFEKLRNQACDDVWEWLNGPFGLENTDVRAKHMTFLWALPISDHIAEIRCTVVAASLDWLEDQNRWSAGNVLGALLDVLFKAAVMQKQQQYRDKLARGVDLAMKILEYRRYERGDQVIAQRLASFARVGESTGLSGVVLRRISDCFCTFRNYHPEGFRRKV